MEFCLFPVPSPIPIRWNGPCRKFIFSFPPSFWNELLLAGSIAGQENEKYSEGYQIGARGRGFLLLPLDDLGDSGDRERFPVSRRGNRERSGGGTGTELVGGSEEGGWRLPGCNWRVLAGRVLDYVDGREGRSHGGGVGGHNSREPFDVIGEM